MGIDPKYTQGVWYDMASDGYVRLVIENGNVIYMTPDRDDRFHTEDPEDFRPGSLVQVDPQAVEDPASYVEERIEEYPETGRMVDTEQTVSLGYAMDHVEIVNAGE